MYKEKLLKRLEEARHAVNHLEDTANVLSIRISDNDTVFHVDDKVNDAVKTDHFIVSCHVGGVTFEHYEAKDGTVMPF